MRRVYLTFALAVAMVAIAGSGLLATTTFWLTDQADGSTQPTQLVVPQGGTVTLHCIMNSDDVGNTYEAMLGYDVSDAGAGAYGPGVDTNDGRDKKLVLSSSKNDIVTSIDSFFDVFTTVGYASQGVVLDASGREDSNTELVGKPYGFVARGATFINGAPGQKKLCSFELSNQMTVPDDFQYVVVSNNLDPKTSYSSAWKYGTALFDDAYALKVINSAVALPVVGTTNKAILDTLTTTAAAQYTWVFWGRVSNVAAGTSFDIDDGSGVVIHVVAAGHSQSNGDYVSVKGSINPATQTLTSQQITTH